MLKLIIVGILVLAVIVIIPVIGLLLSRGKQLKCPDCEYIFNAPIMEEKWSGLGWTFPYMGVIKCHKCGNKRSRRDYSKVEAESEKQNQKKAHTKMVR